MGRVTVIVEHEDGNVQISVPVSTARTVKQTLDVAVAMVAASYQTYTDPNGGPQ